MRFIRHRYYDLKPFLPWRVRLALRRAFARKTLAEANHVWPIDPKSARVPQGWPGWPEGKQFGFILSHDVEGPGGLHKCVRLMKLEMELGFRSSFNFIPEGGYRVSSELRQVLEENGFEVGVHDLRHDGKLYRTKERFDASAARINEYLAEWKAVGFRSGFMHSNLNWLHALNIEYDMSTFDTDPFEPEPEGVRTIFPFFVQNGRPKQGYVEMPYTLPQDSTLFLVLREKNIRIWKEKLDWIAAHGGMALVNVHPDYMSFDAHRRNEFPACLYAEFLEYVRSQYKGCYWTALPREVAQYFRGSASGENSSARANRMPSKKIWIDLDNTPHVPFFKPIIRELEARGYSVVLSARDAFQVCELADRSRLQYQKIGQHYGKNRILKVLGLFWRSLQLLPFVLKEKPVVAVSHGARSQIFLANLLGIPTVLITDYEHAKTPPLVRPKWEIIPDSIKKESLYVRPERIRTYRGIKEDVYAGEFLPDSGLAKELDLEGGNIVVTVRPPATEAHYHNPESEILFAEFMNRLCATPGTKAVLLPRNHKQAEDITRNWPQWFRDGKVVIPKSAVDGLNLLWHSDLVVSGGGTMNREAAALGVPVYSIFRGPIGAVDVRLEAERRLILIKSVDEVHSKIRIEKRHKNKSAASAATPALGDVVNHIDEIVEAETNG